MASSLVHDLKFPDWRAGAKCFEQQLNNHDVASNWGNWAYIVGVGSDPRIGRKFNIVKKIMDYEPDGWLIRRWCPDLGLTSSPMIHESYWLSEEEKEELGITEYLKPIVKMDRAPKRLADSLIGKYDILRSPEWAERVRQDFGEVRVECKK